MIKQLRIKNFKCLREIDLSLGNFNVFIGPNNTGKTSLLDALLFLRKCAGHPLTDCLVEPYFTLDRLLWMGQNSSELSFCLMDDDCQYTISIGNGSMVKEESLVLSKSGEVILKKNKEGWLYKGKTSPENSSLYTFLYFLGDKIHNGEHLELNSLFQTLSHLRLCTLKPSELAKDSYLAPEQLKNPQMNTFGYGLPSILSIMASTAPNDVRYHKIKDYLRQAFPEIINFGIAPVPILKDLEESKILWITGQSLYFEIKGSKQKVPASLMSHGVLLILEYLTLVYTAQSPSVLLIEEPENGIHPKLLKFVVELLRGLSRGLDESTPPVQIILTTYSPYLLDFALPEEVYIFQKDEQGASIITPMSKVEGIQDWLSSCKLGELWYNWGEEELVRRAR